MFTATLMRAQQLAPVPDETPESHADASQAAAPHANGGVGTASGEFIWCRTCESCLGIDGSGTHDPSCQANQSRKRPRHGDVRKGLAPRPPYARVPTRLDLK